MKEERDDEETERNAPAPVAVETEGKLFHVSCFVAHGTCPKIEGWMKKKEREKQLEREFGGKKDIINHI